MNNSSRVSFPNPSSPQPNNKPAVNRQTYNNQHHTLRFDVNSNIDIS